jgi:serine/threonine protein kinase
LTEHTQKPSDEFDLATQSLRSAAQLDNDLILVNRFKIIAPLGQGAQGNVYHAYDQLLEVDIAIKVVETSLQDHSQLNVIRNEVLIARQLQHKNIIHIFDVFEDQGLVFFTMEYIQGEPLINRIAQPINKEDFKLWTQQLFSALSACESAQIKHGDIKPDNILIDNNNNLHLIDFGIGQHLHSDAVQTSGHQDYSAPEVLYGGSSGIQSELFSAGKTIQLMLTRVISNRFSILDRLWLTKNHNFINSLCHPNPLKRLQLAQVNDFYHSQSIPNAQQNSLIFAGLLITIGLLVWLVTKTDLKVNHEASFPTSTIQLGIIHDGKSGLLQSLVQMFEMPLQTNQRLSVVDSIAIQQSADNLALKPALVAAERVDLASLFSLDALIVLSINNIQADDFLIRASIYSMPADISLLEHSRSINANQLEKDLSEFATSLFALLEKQLAKQFDQSETQLLVSGVAALATDKGQSQKSALLPSHLKQLAPEYAGAWYQAAYQAWQQGDIEKAQANLEGLFTLSSESTFWRLQGRLLQAEMNDDLDLATQSIQKLTEGYPNRADLLAKRAEIHEWAGDYPNSIADYQLALDLRPNNARFWFDLARLKIISGDSQSAIENELTRALVIYRKNKDVAGEGLVLNAFGIAHLRRAEYDIAEKYLKDALALYDPERFRLERIKSLANLATVDTLKGQYIEAKSALEEALALLEVEGDTTRQAHVIDTLGILHEEQGLYEQALGYYKRGLDIRSVSGNGREKAQSMSNVAYMHFLIGDFSLADIYWQQAKTLFENNNEQNHLNRTLQNLAQLSLAKGDHLKAARYLTQVSQQLDDSQKQEQMINKLLYSFLNFADGALSNAIKNLNQAQQLAEQTEDNRALTEIYLWHGEVCLQIADIPCLQNQIALAEQSVADPMIEQQVLLHWLQLSADLMSSDLIAVEPLAFVQKIQQANIPVLTEMKILLDIQERWSLPLSSQSMQRLTQIVKPIYYQQYIHLLYLQSSQEDARTALYRQLLSHPKYWRNHIYYQVFDDPKSQEKQQQLTTQWLEQLNEEQVKLYKEHYLEF